jgi:hypothetical protein
LIKNPIINNDVEISGMTSDIKFEEIKEINKMKFFKNNDKNNDNKNDIK